MYKNDSNNVLWFGLVIASIFLAIVFTLAKIMGLNFITGFKVIPAMMLALAAYGYWFYCSRKDDSTISIKTTFGSIPILICILWIMFWPALEYWDQQKASEAFFNDSMSTDFLSTPKEFSAPWYNHWLTKAIGLIAPFGLYFIRIFQQPIIKKD